MNLLHGVIIMTLDARTNLARTLKLLREEKDLTQDELADRIDIGRGSIAMYETGKRMPPAEILVKLALYFDVSLEYLLGLTKSRDRVTLTREEIEDFLGPGDYPDIAELAHYIKKEDLTVEQVKDILETVKKLKEKR